jgi:hypothetical protein
MFLALQEWWVSVDWYRLRLGLLEVLLATAFYLLVASAVTWPVVLHPSEVLVGGGELGGWLWRQWWHFQEIEVLAGSELGLLDRLNVLVSLGRYPETGNILDIVLLSYPLDQLFGFPAHHNLKVLLILIGNGVCAYALARTVTTSRIISLAAGCLAIINPVVVLDVNNTGLRQVLLWWLLLYPIALQRAWRTARALDGLVVGGLFVLIASFYWFYGLFCVMYSVLVMLMWAVRDRPHLGRTLRWTLPAAAIAAMGSLYFVAPYLAPRAEGGSSIGGPSLPELTFFLKFPAYDTIAAAPLRPSNYAENVLSSINRTIGSSWPADYVVNLGHGVMALPAVAFLFGVLPAIARRRQRAWLAVWFLFYLGTLGPFLKIGSLKDNSDVIMLGDYVVRLPYAWMFQFIPGMSRMFAPYRMGSLVVVASVALLAGSLGAIHGVWRQRLAGLLCAAAILVQPFYRFDKGPIARGAKAPTDWRLISRVSAMRVPEWYRSLDPNGWEGIIELPLEQQQDLLYAYQMVHQRKIYRSWATPAAIPPEFRKAGGGDRAKRLRWMAKQAQGRDPVEKALLDIGRDPATADLAGFSDEQLEKAINHGDYRWLLVHERGYFLVRSQEGAALYRDAVRKLTERLGIEPIEIVEQESFTWPGRDLQFPKGPAWIPWAAQEVQLPVPELPRRYFMSVYDLAAWREKHAAEAAPAEVGAEAPPAAAGAAAAGAAPPAAAPEAAQGAAPPAPSAAPSGEAAP